MKKKKLAALLLTGAISVSCLSALAACGGSSDNENDVSQSDSSVSAAQSLGQTTYDDLNASYEILLKISADVRETWYQTIYEDTIKTATLASSLYLPRNYLQQGAAYIAEEIGIKDTVDSLYKTDDYIWVMGLLKKTSSIIYSVLQGYFIKGDLTTVDDKIEAAKDNIKTLTQNYESYKYTDKLNDMYTAVKQFNDFCQSPTGSFATYDSTVNGYKNSYTSAKTSISLFFE